ncbi:hypothetical protein Tco_0997005 [Tanacetum coccineum]
MTSLARAINPSDNGLLSYVLLVENATINPRLCFIVVMSYASSAVTYTSVYTDPEPGRPVAPPSPDYIPGPKDPQTPPVPQDEDEREPMFIHAHDPDYVPEPIYPEYIPLEDKHELLAEEQPLPPVDSPTAESPGYMGEMMDYDDDDSSRDDANDEDEDEDEEDEEEEEHLASADSAVVVSIDEPTSISLPPEAVVERLLAMTTPSPSPPISLSPPSAGERLARCTALPTHSSPPPVPSPLLPSSGCPTQIQTLRIASTQALIDAVTVALPLPPLPPLPPSLYIPPPADRKDDILEFEQPPHKRLCLSTLGSKYKIGESSNMRPTRDPAKAVPEIAPMTVEEVNTRVTELAELHEHYTQDLYALLELAQDRDSMDGEGGGLCFPRGLGSLDRIESGDPLRASDPLRQAQMVESLRVMRDMRREMADMQTGLLALRGQRRARQPAPDARIPNHRDASRDANSHV